METIDDEVTEHALNFIDKCHKQGNPFFVWYNTSGMHFRTHCAEKHKGKSGQGDSNDVMLAHDVKIGTMLAKLDELGIADDTIVMYSTDNGPHYNAWPDAGITPFRSEKNTDWEGGWRVPIFVRWQGKIKSGFAAGWYHPEMQVSSTPWDTALWPGASSSGSTVATAAGLCFAAVDTDTGGSIRLPSAACGIVGLKLT